MEKRLLTIQEMAILLGISPQTIYNRISRKSKRPFPIKPKRIGRSIRFDINDIEEFINNQSQ